MAIGTSLGAYFEDEFHHQAGIDTPPEVMKPKKDTGDDNVAPPDPESQGRSGDPKYIAIANITNSPGEIMEGVEGARQYPSGFSEPERIKSPALRIKGQIYEGPNHGMALTDFESKLSPEQFRDEATYKGFEEGFTTSHGRFIDRNEALTIAKARDQIRPEVLPALTDESTMLLSEDLNPGLGPINAHRY